MYFCGLYKRTLKLNGMQKRQQDREQYFNELATSSRKYFVPYIEQFCPITPGMTVLEIGCGDGGNLLPLAQRGCRVTGVDLAETRIRDARRFFEAAGAEGTFIAQDIFTVKELEHSFDLIICHDVLEHIGDKRTFLANLRRYVREGGQVFMSFPAWQMPFGGHQQICRSRVVSHLPFVHLLPNALYRFILRRAGENEGCVAHLLDIKSTRCPIELFERLTHEGGITIRHRRLYFINPHYETKFGLKPRKLTPLIGCLPWVRNFFTTSCFYMLRF